jgi:hypothetical protein
MTAEEIAKELVGKVKLKYGMGMIVLAMLLVGVVVMMVTSWTRDTEVAKMLESQKQANIAANDKAREADKKTIEGYKAKEAAQLAAIKVAKGQYEVIAKLYGEERKRWDSAKPAQTDSEMWDRFAVNGLTPLPPGSSGAGAICFSTTRPKR